MMVQVLLAVASGAYLMTPAWVTASLEAGRWLPEQQFLSTVHPLPPTQPRCHTLIRSKEIIFGSLEDWSCQETPFHPNSFLAKPAEAICSISLSKLYPPPPRPESLRAPAGGPKTSPLPRISPSIQREIDILGPPGKAALLQCPISRPLTAKGLPQRLSCCRSRTGAKPCNALGEQVRFQRTAERVRRERLQPAALPPLYGKSVHLALGPGGKRESGQLAGLRRLVNALGGKVGPTATPTPPLLR